MKKLNLERYWDLFIKLVKDYQLERGLSQGELANFVGMRRTHLNSLLKRNPDRPLTGYYLLKFIAGGIMTVKDLKFKAESKREEEFHEYCKIAERQSLMRKIVTLEGKGVDVEQLLGGELERVEQLLKNHSANGK